MRLANKLLLMGIGLALHFGVFAQQMKPNIQFDTQNQEIQLFLGEEKLLSSPSKGLWQVSTTWENRWFGNWMYTKPNAVSYLNDKIILEGTLELAEGNLQLKDVYSEEGNLIKVKRRYTWLGTDTLKHVTLGISYELAQATKDILMPSVLYYGNPSGKKSEMTPFLEGKNGEEILLEEHRFPMPFVSVEQKHLQKPHAVTLHSIPSPLANANREDQWWSMGCKLEEDKTILQLLSGACAFNQEKSVIKAFQGKKGKPMFADYDHAYLNLAPEAVIEKTFYLQVYPFENKGSGFQKSVQTSIDLFKPSQKEFPSILEISKQKYAFNNTRWIEGESYAGFNQFDTDNPQFQPKIVLGWVGQAAAPAYYLNALNDVFQSKKDLERAQKSLDFISTATFRKDGLGFYTWYHIYRKEWGERQWKQNPELLSQGQTMYNIARAILTAERKGNLDTKKCRNFLKKASDYHADRMLKNDWHPKSTNEGFFIAPFCLSYQIFGEKKYLKAAEKVAQYYGKRHLDMSEPYWGGTLDAKCEDKEGAWAALQGFLDLYKTTKEEKYLDWAQHACDVVLSYVYVWDVALPAGRLSDHQFKTRGWTSVSVQNMHIDIYGVLIAPYIYELGELTANKQLKDMALLMYRSCGQLIDEYGSQGEQVQQTTYTQDSRKLTHDISEFRGNYVEDWTVFWITAHFLNAAAQFHEMGIPLDCSKETL
ncbi:hypothetical protein [Sediminitomix flava]|uniref:Uncharacterized protein n=1 Tax=Sediminitomix flava TaxID=379075 RepID=A0A315Z6A1_SEDFL|nr:hypothetical protein [Sediminitomix flava]PWJ37891.1 hypothetical protein BC781_10826 [Sediminitomix flava]